MSKKNLTIAAFVAATGAIALSSTPVSAAEVLTSGISTDNVLDLGGNTYIQYGNANVGFHHYFGLGRSTKFHGWMQFSPDFQDYGRTMGLSLMSANGPEYNTDYIEYQEIQITKEQSDKIVDKYTELDDKYDTCKTAAGKITDLNTQTQAMNNCANQYQSSFTEYFKNSYPLFKESGTWTRANRYDNERGVTTGVPHYSYTNNVPGAGIIWVKYDGNVSVTIDGNIQQVKRTMYTPIMSYDNSSTGDLDSGTGEINPGKPSQLPKTGQFERNITLVLTSVAMISVGLYLAGVAKRMR